MTDDLPKPDTHCFDDDTGKDVWSYSADQMRSYAAAATALERERWQSMCAGKRHNGCSYLATCGSVCNKCGKVA